MANLAIYAAESHRGFGNADALCAGFPRISSINKPVVGIFRMLGMMSGNRVAVKSTAGLSLDDVRDRGVRGPADVHALASRDARSAAVLVWNYHDDDLPGPAATVHLTIGGLPPGRPTLTHYRVDGDHSNAYDAWKRMGSPQAPTATQLAELERAARLETIGPPTRVEVVDGRVAVTFTLPRQGVSLIRLTNLR